MELLKSPGFYISVILVAIIFYMWGKKDASGLTMNDCIASIKNVAARYGQTNLDSKTGTDFYNYLLG